LAAAFTKLPVARLLIAIEIVKVWFAGIISVFFGLVNLEEGRLVLAAMRPIAIGLHEPVFVCIPLVITVFWVRQKLTKLFVLVNDGTWPASATACPLLAWLDWRTRGSTVRLSWGSVEFELVEFEPPAAIVLVVFCPPPIVDVELFPVEVEFDPVEIEAVDVAAEAVVVLSLLPALDVV